MESTASRERTQSIKQLMCSPEGKGGAHNHLFLVCGQIEHGSQLFCWIGFDVIVGITTGAFHDDQIGRGWRCWRWAWLSQLMS